MIFKAKDGNGGKWIIKKKFTFAGFALLAGWVFQAYMLHKVATPITADDVASMMEALGKYTLGVLVPVFGADVADKLVTGRKYDEGAQ